MKTTFLFQKDRRCNLWLFWFEADQRRIRDEYRQFVCPRCKKVDELNALRAKGFHEFSRPKGLSRRDFYQFDDGPYLFTTKLAQFMRSEGVQGLDFFPARPAEWEIAWPSRPLKVDISGFKQEEKCSECGRFRETVGIPSGCLSSKKNKERVIYTPSILSESIISARPLLVTGESVVALFQKFGVRGMDFVFLG